MLNEVADCWLEAIAAFFDSIGRSALAVLARSLIEVERADRAEQNELMTEANARKLTQKQLRIASTKRREALAREIGGGGDDGDLTSNPT